MIHKKITYGLNDINEVVDSLIGLLDTCKIFTFSGSLGAGKTTLVRSILRKLGVAEPVSSPTFTYLQIYENDKGQKFYHFDLYRLSSAKEFFESGFDEYLDLENSFVFIEWPEIIKDILPIDKTCIIDIDYVGFDRRCAEVSAKSENKSVKV